MSLLNFKQWFANLLIIYGVYLFYFIELRWTLAEIEKPLHLLTKVFLMNYPLYVAVKQYPHYKTEEVTQQEVSAINLYCDVQDIDMPLLLLRTVNIFCRYIA